jgi:hypothetical protein
LPFFTFKLGNKIVRNFKDEWIILGVMHPHISTINHWWFSLTSLLFQFFFA